jgi:hypothetical protein
MTITRTWSPSQIWQVRYIDRFSSESRIPPSSIYVPSGNFLRLVDLQTRTIRTAFQASEPIESFAFSDRVSGRVKQPSGEQAFVVRTATAIVVLNADHDVIRTFAIPGKSQNAHRVDWSELADGQSLAQFFGERRTQNDENIAPCTLYRIAADGTIVDRTELALQSGMLKWSKQPEAKLLAYSFPSPLILPIAETFVVLIINQPGSFTAAVRMMLGSSWPSLLAVTILALALAFAAWRRARAFGLPGPDQAVWAIFVFLFGIPGYVGYRLHRRWRIRAECPHCHAQAPRDRVACAACDTAFPAPALKGIEVFA